MNCEETSLIDIPGYEELYAITKTGKVWSSRSGKFLKQKIEEKGYCVVRLYKNSTPKAYKVHRLVAFAYIDNPDKLPFIDHINGIRNDNRLENLQWITNAENVRKSPYFKMTREKVEEIKSLEGTLSQRKIAKRYGVSQSFVWRVFHRKLWVAV